MLLQRMCFCIYVINFWPGERGLGGESIQGEYCIPRKYNVPLIINVSP